MSTWYLPGALAAPLQVFVAAPALSLHLQPRLDERDLVVRVFHVLAFAEWTRLFSKAASSLTRLDVLPCVVLPAA